MYSYQYWGSILMLSSHLVWRILNKILLNTVINTSIVYISYDRYAAKAMSSCRSWPALIKYSCSMASYCLDHGVALRLVWYLIALLYIVLTNAGQKTVWILNTSTVVGLVTKGRHPSRRYMCLLPCSWRISTICTCETEDIVMRQVSPLALRGQRQFRRAEYSSHYTSIVLLV